MTYPATAVEIALPELDGKTAKMYRGGKICLSDHFKPLWARNVPKFGIAHAMALGVSKKKFLFKQIIIIIIIIFFKCEPFSNNKKINACNLIYFSTQGVSLFIV